MAREVRLRAGAHRNVSAVSNVNETGIVPPIRSFPLKDLRHPEMCYIIRYERRLGALDFLQLILRDTPWLL
jgi:hypothetical protein